MLQAFEVSFDRLRIGHGGQQQLNAAGDAFGKTGEQPDDEGALHAIRLFAPRLQLYRPDVPGPSQLLSGRTRSCPSAAMCRRRFLNALAWASPALALRQGRGQQAELAASTSNGGSDPYPIPWLDKNGSHNQPAGPGLEPSHIYHFKGRVARCSTFTGMGMSAV